MGNTDSTATSQQPKAEKKPETESYKDIAITAALMGEHMNKVCARIMPVNKPVGNKGPQLPT
jgi:hypothetical protein